MNWQGFTFDVTEYSTALTGNCHNTVIFLHRQGYLTAEQTEELLSRMVVVPVRNTPKLGERLLRRFFKKDDKDDVYTFPIALLDHAEGVMDDTVPKRRGKPHLEVVTNEE